jgi:hypothetical protein
MSPVYLLELELLNRGSSDEPDRLRPEYNDYPKCPLKSILHTLECAGRTTAPPQVKVV